MRDESERKATQADGVNEATDPQATDPAAANETEATRLAREERDEVSGGKARHADDGISER